MENCSAEPGQAASFKRNIDLESLLTPMNESLSAAEERLLSEGDVLGSEHPLIFNMGILRSGATLFMQWLANSGIVAYPSNLLSRFYRAPAIGSQIQLLLTDPRSDFRNEIPDSNRSISFRSENGKTAGTLEASEFWYFWQRFLPVKDIDWLPDENLARIFDKEMLHKELTALSGQLGRDSVSNVASVLDARERQFGGREQWYSFKIPERPQPKDLNPVVQAAEQVVHIERAGTQGIGSIDQSRAMRVQCENFCEARVAWLEDGCTSSAWMKLRRHASGLRASISAKRRKNPRDRQWKTHRRRFWQKYCLWAGAGLADCRGSTP